MKPHSHLREPGKNLTRIPWSILSCLEMALSLNVSPQKQVAPDGSRGKDKILGCTWSNYN